MNVREKARRSDALHYDYISRRDLCNMIVNLESDIEELKTENAKLQASNEVISEDHAALCEQNTKLQKLAAQMGEMLDCVVCDRQVGCNWQDDGPCWYETELKKLISKDAQAEYGGVDGQCKDSDI